LPSIETKEVQASTRTQDARIRRFQVWSSTCRQFLRYCLVGGVNTLIDLLMLNVFLWRLPTHNAQVLVLYNSVAYTSGAVSSFFLNKYWTFGRKLRPTWREVMRFVISLCFEVLYSNGLMWLAGKALQPVITNATLWGNASKLLTVAGGSVISYICMRFWTFAGVPRDRSKKQETFHLTTSGAATIPESSLAQHVHHHAESE
jgi:putative flippase GtrA